MVNNDVKDVYLMAFESPRVFGDVASQYVSIKLHPNVIRTTHCHDPVVQLPFALPSPYFVHIVGEYFYDCGVTVLVSDTKNSPNGITCKGRTDPTCVQQVIVLISRWLLSFIFIVLMIIYLSTFRGYKYLIHSNLSICLFPVFSQYAVPLGWGVAAALAASAPLWIFATPLAFLVFAATLLGVVEDNACTNGVCTTGQSMANLASHSMTSFLRGFIDPTHPSPNDAMVLQQRWSMLSCPSGQCPTLISCTCSTFCPIIRQAVCTCATAPLTPCCNPGFQLGGSSCTCEACTNSCPVGQVFPPDSCTCIPCSNQCSLGQSLQTAGSCDCTTCPSCPPGQAVQTLASCACTDCPTSCSVGFSLQAGCVCAACSNTCPLGQAIQTAGSCDCTACPSIPGDQQFVVPGNCAYTNICNNGVTSPTCQNSDGLSYVLDPHGSCTCVR